MKTKIHLNIIYLLMINTNLNKGAVTVPNSVTKQTKHAYFYSNWQHMVSYRQRLARPGRGTYRSGQQEVGGGPVLGRDLSGDVPLTHGHAHDGCHVGLRSEHKQGD